jgi:hypothetical protein
MPKTETSTGAIDAGSVNAKMAAGVEAKGCTAVVGNTQTQIEAGGVCQSEPEG